MFTQDTVTVVTAATGHKNLAKCIASVQRQTYPHVRHWIVIDGAEHAARVREVVACADQGARPVEILCVPEPTGKDRWCGHRIYAAAAYLSNAEFIAFLDEDNWFEPDHVASLMAAVRATRSRWAFSLRNIVDQEGRFIARDECECLGHLHPVYFNKNIFHVDTNCFLLGREVAVQFSQAWYRPTRPPQGHLEADTYMCQLLLHSYPPGCSNRRHTVNYVVGNRPDSIRAEFFLQGNQVMRAAYPAALPWEQACNVQTGYPYPNQPAVERPLSDAS